MKNPMTVLVLAVCTVTVISCSDTAGDAASHDSTTRYDAYGNSQGGAYDNAINNDSSVNNGVESNTMNPNGGAELHPNDTLGRSGTGRGTGDSVRR
jgi:hypothetical protein